MPIPIFFSFVERFEYIIGFDGDFAFVEHGAVEAEDVNEEVVDGLALVFLEVVTLVGQVDVANVILGTIKTIDALQIGELWRFRYNYEGFIVIR